MISIWASLRARRATPTAERTEVRDSRTIVSSRARKPVVVIADQFVRTSVVIHRQAGVLDAQPLEAIRDAAPLCQSFQSFPEGVRDCLSQGLMGQFREFAGKPVGFVGLDAQRHPPQSRTDGEFLEEPDRVRGCEDSIRRSVLDPRSCSA